MQMLFRQQRPNNRPNQSAAEYQREHKERDHSALIRDSCHRWIKRPTALMMSMREMTVPKSLEVQGSVHWRPVPQTDCLRSPTLFRTTSNASPSLPTATTLE